MIYLLKYNGPRCPRDSLLEDLSVHINEYKKKGESMVVLCDWNEDARGDTIKDFRESNGLYNVVIETFVNPVNALTTYNWGRKLIDRIMATR